MNSDEVITVLIPTSAEESGLSLDRRVEEVEAIGGRAFEITSRDHCDLLLIRDRRGSAQVETVRMISDFNWAWARFERNEDGRGKLSELLVMQGQHLRLDGREVLKSENTINHLVAARIDDRFRVETNDGLMDLSFPIEDLTQLFAESNQRSHSVSPAVIGAYNVPSSWIRD